VRLLVTYDEAVRKAVARHSLALCPKGIWQFSGPGSRKSVSLPPSLVVARLSHLVAVYPWDRVLRIGEQYQKYGHQ